MSGANFTIIYWNIWHANQLHDKRLQNLMQRFDELIDEYQPDAFGLNEVVAWSKDGSMPKILQHLESRGYHTTYAPFGPISQTHITGSAFASRNAPTDVQLHRLGPDNAARRRGFPGYNVTSIFADIPTKTGEVLRVGVNHLAHLVPSNWKAHAQHHRKLVSITQGLDFRKRLIMGGDFNQPKRLTSLGSIAKRYHRATGSLGNVTWRLGGLPFAPLRANYDNIFWSKCGTVTLQHFAVLPNHPSDHSPLLGRFQIGA